MAGRHASTPFLDSGKSSRIPAAAQLDAASRIIFHFSSFKAQKIAQTCISLGAYLHGKKVLHGNGCVTNAEMEKHVKMLYNDFDQRRKTYEAKLADEEDMRELKQLENTAKDIERKR